jgi:hypothetical protein
VSDMFDMLPDRAGAMLNLWQGRIIANATDFADELDIVIDDIDPTIKFDGCRWMARNSIDLPQSGDICLVAFDNNNRPWVVVWWPF